MNKTKAKMNKRTNVRIVYNRSYFINVRINVRILV